ncbi:MAG: S41 family peptidase, partial [Bacteroidota bacterium]
TKGRLPQFDNEYHSTDGGKYEKVPLIVLIDYGSASASEIVSGAVQDLDRGLVIGETSFGKGLVQNEYPLSDGSAFRLTISRYYTPSGRCIQRPYDDKDAYVKMQDRLDLKEGDNLDHKLEELAAEGTDLPIHHTIGGRKVVGGGGIMPDYIVKYDTLTKLSIQIRMKNVFNSFAMNFLSKHGDEFKAKYEKDFKAFLRDFDIEGEYLEEFKELVKSKDIEWDEEQFNTDKEYLFRAAKSRIANAVWDNNEAAQVFLPVYPQIQKAIELFPAAEKFAKLN